MRKFARRFVSEADGQDLIDYTLLLAFLALLAVLAFVEIGQSTSSIWSVAGSHLKHGHSKGHGKGLNK